MNPPEQITLENATASVVLAGVLLAAILGVLFWREFRLSKRPRLLPVVYLLRCLAVAGVWLALANPNAVITRRQEKKPRGVLAIDTSASMRSRDVGPGSLTRLRWQSKADATPMEHASALLGVTALNLTRADSALDSAQVPPLLQAAEEAAQLAGRWLRRSASAQPGRRKTLLDALERELLPGVTRLRRESGLRGTPQDGQLQSLAGRFAHLREEAWSAAGERPETRSTALASDSRMELARAWLHAGRESWLERLQARTELESIQFAGAPSPVNAPWLDLQAEDPAAPHLNTDLQAILDELARRASTGSLDFAIVLTDGVHTGPALRLPESLRRVPLLVLPIGDVQSRRDLALGSIDAPKTLLLGDTWVAQASLHAMHAAGESTVVELVDGEVVLDSQSVAFRSHNETRLVDLRWKPVKVGTRELKVRVRGLSGEMTEANNQRNLSLSVVEDRFSVLLADDLPRWETRYLQNLLAREPRCELTRLLFEPRHAYPGRALPPPAQLPGTLEQWQRFQVVVLGDLSPQQLTDAHQNLLKRHVELGGRLVVVAGEESMPAKFANGPIADLLPVSRGLPVPALKGGWWVEPTAEGLACPALHLNGPEPARERDLWHSVFRAMPLHRFSAWSKPKPGARVLLQAVPPGGAQGGGRAFLSTQTYGRGSVTFLAAPQTYQLRWRFGDEFHYRFWGQLVRSLLADHLAAGSSELRIDTDALLYTQGEPVRVRVRRSFDGSPSAGAAPEIVAFQNNQRVAAQAAQPDGEIPGRYEAVFHGLPNGRVELRCNGQGLTISIGEEPRHAELQPPLETPAFFSMLARQPAAMQLAPAAMNAALEHLPWAPSVEVQTERRSLWDRWALLLAIIGLLGLEWLLRKTAGLT